MKEEARILVFGLNEHYGVFATFRKDFLEEFNIIHLRGLNLTRHLESVLSTYNEISYMIGCTESKYDPVVQGFKVLEGWTELVQRHKYCQLIKLVLCILNRRGLINPPHIELLVERSDKCLAW